MTTTYQIQTRTESNPSWTSDGLMAIGENRWATREEAEQAIEEARRLGDEWAAAEYRVVEVR
jgi:hypothetical protein